jgi:hypothetical protein
MNEKYMVIVSILRWREEQKEEDRPESALLIIIVQWDASSAREKY